MDVSLIRITIMRLTQEVDRYLAEENRDEAREESSNFVCEVHFDYYPHSLS